MTLHETQLFSAFVLVIALLLLWRVMSAIKEGSIGSLNGTVPRQSDPLLFWFYVGWSALAAACMFGFAILGVLGILWRLGHPGVQ